MNIDELLKDEKVEWKIFGEVSAIKTVTAPKKLVKKQYAECGKFPIIDQGQEFIVGYTDDNEAVFPSRTYVIFGDHTECLKYVDFPFVQGADGIKVIKTDESVILSRYLYHLILTYYRKTGKYTRHYSMLKEISIPIPQIEVQEKIVEILDEFIKYVSELTTELTTELIARRKQYTYYRDILLSEKYLNKLSETLGNGVGEVMAHPTVAWKKLGEVGTFTRGNGLQKKDFVENGKPVIHYGQIYTRYGFSADETVAFTSDEVFSKLIIAQPNDIVMATTSENVEDVGKSVVWLGNEEIGISGDSYVFSTNQNSKYIAYFFQTTAFQLQKERKVTGTKVIRINAKDMEKFILPLPSLPVQAHVVSILDKFDTLTSNLRLGLPKEIELRQKQYEYYRERLLSFE